MRPLTETVCINAEWREGTSSAGGEGGKSAAEITSGSRPCPSEPSREVAFHNWPYPSNVCLNSKDNEHGIKTGTPVKGYSTFNTSVRAELLAFFVLMVSEPR